MKLRKVKLNDICDLITCGVAKRPNYVESGIPFLSARNIKKQKIIWNNYKFISQKTHKELTKYNKPLKGDILYTRVGSYGEAAIVDDDREFSLFVSLTLIKPKHDIINNKFLVYFLNSPIGKLMAKKNVNSSGVGNLNVSKVRNFEILLPSLQEQKKIVAKLDKLYGEIDTQINLIEKKSENILTFLNQFLATVKGDKIKLDDLVDIKTGKLDSNAMVDGGKYPFFTCSKQIFNIDTFAFDCEAVLLAGNNASGDFNVKHYKGKFNAYQRTYVITVKDSSKIQSRYLYFQLIQALSKFKTMSVGSNTKFLKIDMIKNFEIPLPSLNQQKILLKKLKIIEQNLNFLDSNILKQKHNYSQLKSAIFKKEFNQKHVA